MKTDADMVRTLLAELEELKVKLRQVMLQRDALQAEVDRLRARARTTKEAP